MAVVATVFITAFITPSGKLQATFTDKYWLMESSSIVPAFDMNGDGKPDADMKSYLQPCDLDDLELFKTNGKFYSNAGKLKCDENQETEEEKGTYTYNAASKQITLHQIDVESPIVVTLKELTATKMVGSFEFTSPDGVKHVVTATYKIK